jgi:TolA-binding protein
MMAISEKVLEALRAGILLNERVTTLIGKVNRLDQDIRRMNERLIRLETLFEVAKMQQNQSEQPRIEP